MLMACCFARPARRLRAIGHLHEAPACASHADREDESQEFLDLHAANRKAYQTDGTIPDWETSAQAAKAVRQVAV